MKIKLSFFVILFALIGASAFAQNSANSPYTRWGYGQISDQAFGPQRAMGGIGYGLRDGSMINPLNPAAFSEVDSLTFMLDFGVTLQRSWYDDGYNKSQNTNANIEYIAMQFPLYKNIGMGIGFKPITSVGYKYGENYADSVKTFNGKGGIDQIYGSLSYSFKNIALGASVGYVFGNIMHNGSATFSNSSTFPFMNSDTLSVSGLALEFGIQYTIPIKKEYELTLGAVYSPKLSLAGNYHGVEIVYNGTINPNITTKTKPSGYEMPEMYGVGATFTKKGNFVLGIDYSRQNWANAQFEGATNQFNNRDKFSIGGEFIPNIRSRSYLSNIRYRLGGNFANAYISPLSNIDGKAHSFDEYSISCGFGFPLPGGRSLINTAFEYAATKSKQKNVGLIDEQYFKVTVSYTFNELWFFKRKLQ